jgi:hypothetical protein
VSFCECGNENSGSIKCGEGREDLLAFRVGLYSVEVARRVESLAEISPCSIQYSVMIKWAVLNQSYHILVIKRAYHHFAESNSHITSWSLSGCIITLLNQSVISHPDH